MKYNFDSRKQKAIGRKLGRQKCNVSASGYVPNRFAFSLQLTANSFILCHNFELRTSNTSNLKLQTIKEF